MEVIPSSCKFPTSLSCLQPNNQMQQKEIQKAYKKLQMALTFFVQVSYLLFVSLLLISDVKLIQTRGEKEKREHYQVSSSSQTGLNPTHI